MRPQSCKSKGRRLQQAIARDLLDAFPSLQEDDVRSTSMGASGEDVLLSPRARELVPFSFEAKNQERLAIWSAIEQCEANKGSREPCVVLKKNRSETYAVVRWKTLLALIARDARRGGALPHTPSAAPQASKPNWTRPSPASRGRARPSPASHDECFAASVRGGAPAAAPTAAACGADVSGALGAPPWTRGTSVARSRSCAPACARAST